MLNVLQFSYRAIFLLLEMITPVVLWSSAIINGRREELAALAAVPAAVTTIDTFL